MRTAQTSQPISASHDSNYAVRRSLRMSLSAVALTTNFIFGLCHPKSPDFSHRSRISSFNGIPRISSSDQRTSVHISSTYSAHERTECFKLELGVNSSYSTNRFNLKRNSPKEEVPTKIDNRTSQ